MEYRLSPIIIQKSIEFIIIAIFRNLPYHKFEKGSNSQYNPKRLIRLISMIILLTEIYEG